MAFETARVEQHHLKDKNELLWRQAHPEFIKGGEITSQVFRPGDGDQNKLSVVQASVITAEAAFNFHTNELKLASSGTWALTVGEVNNQALEVIDDRKDSTPGHALIDFGTSNNANNRRIGQILKILALQRGQIYP